MTDCLKTIQSEPHNLSKSVNYHADFKNKIPHTMLFDAVTEFVSNNFFKHIPPNLYQYCANNFHKILNILLLKIMNNEDVKKSIASGEKKLCGRGRLLIRESGTEPLIRVMAEGLDEDLVNAVVGDIVSAVKRAAIQ